jgi:diguanylate cyclase (GGDEF)-like protein
MKLKNKIAIIISLVSVSIVVFILVFYFFWSRHLIIEEEKNGIVDMADALSQEIDTHFREISYTTTTLAYAPSIQKMLIEDNSIFESYEETEREAFIMSLEEKWNNTSDLNDEFLQQYLSNSTSDYLNLQKKLGEKRYGEIFITNRYGVVIASTNKLTTISHAHKYWWIAAYSDAKGRVFIDDRGFDESADGYVLGVVIPIKCDGEIIGMLKANITVLDLLSHLASSFEDIYHNSKVQIVRTNGLVVIEKDLEPLATSIGGVILENINKKNTCSFEVNEHNSNWIVGLSVVESTLGSEKFGFGGSYESIDHILGNTGESWHTVISIREKDVLGNVRNTTQILFVMGSFMMIVSIFLSKYFGDKIAKPIVKLTDFSQSVGDGNLDNRIVINTSDEIGTLASSYNRMIDNLQHTMASKDALEAEIVKRKTVEAKLKTLSITDELTGAYNRRASNEFIRKALEKKERYEEMFSVILIDIDYFKMVNDTFGHDCGDRVLVRLTQLLIDSVRNVDLVSRIGGEEFLIVLPQIRKDKASELADRLRLTVAEYKFDKINQLTISLGVAEGEANDNWDSLIKRVDNALYHSKKSGRNQVTVM